MIAVRPYLPAHLRALVVEGGQAHLGPLVENEAYAEALAAAGPNYSAIDEHGRVLCVAGIYVPWEGRALAHAILSSDCGRHLTSIVRAIGGFLEEAAFERVEAHVQTEREECHRFARLLGFERECTMRRFLAGDDFDLYSRVRAWK